jgi:copper chaperone CopZ
MMNEHNNCHADPLEKPLNQAALTTAKAVFLMVWGMGCPRCALRVQNGLLSLEPVFYARVFLEDCLAVAAYDPERLTTGDLVGAVAAAGNDGRHEYRAMVLGQVPATEVLSL